MSTERRERKRREEEAKQHSLFLLTGKKIAAYVAFWQREEAM